MNLVEVGLLLNRSVHVLDEDESRILRELAHRQGATAPMLAAALRLRDKRVAEDVTVVGA